MRVLISGGGIAGLTLAYWLHQHQISAVVIEQAKQMRREGYGIDFFGTGYDVAERMDLIGQLATQQLPFDAILYLNKRGKPVVSMDSNLMKSVLDGKYMALMHWTLEEALYNALKERVEVRFDRTLTAVRQDLEQVEVTFNDGTSEPFDLLIGADGVHSLTRKLVFGPEEQFSHYLGYTIACYPLPDRYRIGHAWKMHVDPGRLAGAYCSKQEGEIVTLFMYEAAERESLSREQRLPRLRQVFEGMGWVTQQMLADTPVTENIFMDAVTQIQMPTWQQGRVALVGDACGCPTLISGQGASLAMGGAYLLAEALGKTSGYREAFRLYEQRVRPHVQTQQKSARSFAKTFVPGSTFSLLTQQIMMKVLMRNAFTGLLQRQFGAQSILPPPHKTPQATQQAEPV